MPFSPECTRFVSAFTRLLMLITILVFIFPCYEDDKK